MVVTTGYPYSSHKATYIHNLFQNGAATLSGVVEMFWERKRRGELDHYGLKDDFTFVMITGDGGMDIGMGPAIGAALRNHKMIILEYDNEGYMNTGAQLSYSTPIGHRTSTSNVGKIKAVSCSIIRIRRKSWPRRIFRMCSPDPKPIPQDLVKKAAKAQWYAQNEGLVYGKISDHLSAQLAVRRINWAHDIVEAAVDSCFFPLYEVEHGVYDDYLQSGRERTRDSACRLAEDDGQNEALDEAGVCGNTEKFEDEVERRWETIESETRKSIFVIMII